MDRDKLKKISVFIIIMLLVIMPCSVFANEGENGGSSEEVTPTPTPSTTPSESPEPSVTPTPSEEPVVEVISISLPSTLELIEGNTEELVVTISPEDATDKTVTWSSSDEKVVKVSQKGVVTAVKAGTATVVAVSSSGERASCVVTVTKKAVVEKSTDNSLKKLEIINGTLDKKFDNDVMAYTVTVDKSVTELEFDFEFNHSNAKYLISNNNSLITGKIVKFVAIAEDGETKKTYEFTIKKEEANLNLKSLKIKGYALNETFSANKLEYTAEIPYEAVDVTIETAPEDSDAKVKITGATGLIVGDNTVIITVTDTSGNKREYKIVVTRLAEDEREEVNNSSKYTSATSDDSVLLSGDTNNNDSGPDHTLRYVFVTIGCVILFAIGALGIYFYIITSTKTKKNKKGNKKNDLTLDSDNTESPLIETNDSDNKMVSIMPGDLEETREFRTDDIMSNSIEIEDDLRKSVEELLDD